MVSRTSRFCYVVATLGLAVSLWAFRIQPDLARFPDEDKLRGIAFPAQLEHVTAGTYEELRFLAEGYPPGREVRIVPAGSPPIRETLIRAHSRSYLMVTLISGLCFFAVSLFVFAPRADTATGRTFFWSVLLFGTSILIGGVYFPQHDLAPALVTGATQVSILAALPVLFLYLALSFPRRREVLDRHRWVMPVVVAAALGVAAWQMVAYYRYFVDPGPAAGRAMARSALAADLALVTLCGAGCVTLFQSSRRLELRRERSQVKWLLWGIVIGLTPYVFLRTLPQSVGLSPLFGPAVDRLFELAIPVAFTVAVVRHQFLDIDVVIRRSVMYGVFAALTVALYVGLGLLVKTRVGGAADLREWMVIVAVGVLAGILFNPARRSIGRWVDRAFFKIRQDHDGILTALRTKLSDAVDERSMAEVLDRCIERGLHPSRHGVVLRGMGRSTVAGTLDTAFADAFVDSIPDGAGTAAAPSATSLPEVERPNFPDDGELVLTQSSAHGSGEVFILLGERSTGRHYVEEDVRLLQAAAGTTAIALERLHLIQTVGEEHRRNRQLDELQRLKSDFLSRVAHDLRTPLASITWSADNLLDGLTGPVSERQTEYLQSIKASSDRLTHMVGNLLEISRLERGVIEIDLEDVRLQDVLDEAVGSIDFLAREKHVTIERDYADIVPIGRGNEQRLYEVALNLLENAVHFAPRESVVEVCANGGEAGVCEFAIRDHGPGLGGMSADDLFRPFYQGVANHVEHKHGFGLGLHIVRSYMGLMRGQVTANTHPDGGAIFTCTLPAAGGDARSSA